MGPGMHGGSRELHPANAEDNDETRTIGELKEQLEAQLASLNTQLASLSIKGNDDPEPSISRSTDNANAVRLINATAKNPQFILDVHRTVDASRTTQEHEQPSGQSSQSKDLVDHSSPDAEPRTVCETTAAYPTHDEMVAVDRHEQPEASDKGSPPSDNHSLPVSPRTSEIATTQPGRSPPSEDLVDHSSPVAEPRTVCETTDANPTRNEMVAVDRHEQPEASDNGSPPSDNHSLLDPQRTSEILTSQIVTSTDVSEPKSQISSRETTHSSQRETGSVTGAMDMRNLGDTSAATIEDNDDVNASTPELTTSPDTSSKAKHGPLSAMGISADASSTRDEINVTSPPARDEMHVTSSTSAAAAVEEKEDDSVDDSMPDLTDTSDTSSEADPADLNDLEPHNDPHNDPQRGLQSPQFHDGDDSQLQHHDDDAATTTLAAPNEHVITVIPDEMRSVVMLPLSPEQIQLGLFHDEKYWVVTANPNYGLKFAGETTHFGGIYKGNCARMHFELGGLHDEVDPSGVHIEPEHEKKQLGHDDVIYVDQNYAVTHGFPLTFIDASALTQSRPIAKLVSEVDTASKAAINKQSLPPSYGKVGFGKYKQLDLRIQRTIDDNHADYDQIISDTHELLQLERGQQIKSLSAMALGTSFQTPHQDFKPATAARDIIPIATRESLSMLKACANLPRPSDKPPEHATTRPVTICGSDSSSGLRPPSASHTNTTTGHSTDENAQDMRHEKFQEVPKRDVRFKTICESAALQPTATSVALSTAQSPTKSATPELTVPVRELRDLVAVGAASGDPMEPDKSPATAVVRDDATLATMHAAEPDMAKPSTAKLGTATSAAVSPALIGMLEMMTANKHGVAATAEKIVPTDDAPALVGVRGGDESEDDTPTAKSKTANSKTAKSKSHGLFPGMLDNNNELIKMCATRTPAAATVAVALPDTTVTLPDTTVALPDTTAALPDTTIAPPDTATIVAASTHESHATSTHESHAMSTPESPNETITIDTLKRDPLAAIGMTIKKKFTGYGPCPFIGKVTTMKASDKYIVMWDDDSESTMSEKQIIKHQLTRSDSDGTSLDNTVGLQP